MHYLTFIKKPIKLTFAERLFAVAVLAVSLQLSFPQYSHAAVPITTAEHTTGGFVIGYTQTSDSIITPVPTPLVFTENAASVSETTPAKPRRTIWVMVTAYSSAPEETDGSPYITAKNTFVRDGVVAANFLPFNTRLRMPQYFGEKEFVVEDRMNTRYFERIDIWMPSKAAAKQWGARWVKIEVL